MVAIAAERVAAQLDKPSRTSTGWKACCPAHEDRDPSLSIDQGDDGRVLVHCHGGCTQSEVLAGLKRLGISLNGQPMRSDRQHYVNGNGSAPITRQRDPAIIPVPDDAPELLQPSGAQYRFEFRDLAGVLHFIVTREDRPKSGEPSSGKDHWKRPLPWVFTAQGWRNRAPPHGRIPYGLQDLARCGEDTWVVIVQGELKRDALQEVLRGNPVLTNMGGDASVLLTNWGDLADRNVDIWPDNDNSGRKAAHRLAEHLNRLGCRVRVLQPPDSLGPSEDVHDLIKRNEFSVDLLKSMHSAACDWTPKAVDEDHDAPAVSPLAAVPEINEQDADEQECRRMPLDWPALADLVPPDREWAIPGWLGIGHATLLAGEGGSGKSLLIQTMATALAVGKPYFFATPHKPRVCVLWEGEDDRDELWRRQCSINEYLEVDMRDLDGYLILEPLDGRDMLLAAPSMQIPGRLLATPMLDELRDQVGDYGADVVVLDTVARIFGGSENDRGHVTRLIAMLTGAMPRPVALVLLAHPSRTPGAEFSGSSAWEGSVRSRLLFGRKPPDAKDHESDAEDESVRFLARRKANYSGRDSVGFNYDVEKRLFVPQVSGISDDFYRLHHARDVLRSGLRELLRRNLGHPTGKATSPNRYLPKMIRDNGLSQGVSLFELKRALNSLMKEGKLREVDGVSKDSGGRPQSGLAIQE